ncbi:hypothetical protein N7491_009976 [Penicillium cf. griseofulvum]|uniref:Uncharacterized protein n=1 Tax=Penicillium cf. griseofulvum TaxID=2972120 RepID=A0A9W9T5E2_9EURO|nr:hypothetical protein N7472_000308 [Penicillium cf. griseofulvum]KAJ5421531.1 hypothetical protein N7491_009976 [Penicillium cf. griseofulvum]KAJ5424766.1 hypothetical protein N7445_010739 [Penicillium cf. griseofulvum]
MAVPGAMRLAALLNQRLLKPGEANPPTTAKTSVDKRAIQEVISSEDVDDPIKVFVLPEGWYAQECSFVPRREGKTEDDR